MGGPQPRLLYLRGLNVDADDLAGRNGLSEPERNGTRAAADVEEAHAGSQMRQQEGRVARGGPHRKLRFEGRVRLLRIDLRHDHSALIPASRTISFQRGSSARMSAPRAWGPDFSTGYKPRRVSRACTSD